MFKLVFQSAGIYACFLTLGFLTENLSKKGFHNEVFLLAVCSLLNFIICRAVLHIRGRQQNPSFNQQPFKWVAASFVVGTLTSHLAIRYISYPAQVLGKSLKPVAVILSNTIFLGIRYPLSKYLVVAAITLGITLYSWDPNRGGTVDSSTLGLGLIFVSLACDGLTASLQDKWSRGERERGLKPDSIEAQYLTNAWGFLYLAIIGALSGEITHALAALAAQPELVLELFVFAACSTVGQFFIYSVVTDHGGLVNSVVTTTRKFFSILLSVVLFNPGLLREQQWLGVVLVFGALLYDMVVSNHRTPAHQHKD